MQKLAQPQRQPFLRHTFTSSAFDFHTCTQLGVWGSASKIQQLMLNSRAWLASALWRILLLSAFVSRDRDVCLRQNRTQGSLAPPRLLHKHCLDSCRFLFLFIERPYGCRDWLFGRIDTSPDFELSECLSEKDVHPGIGYPSCVVPPA